jgi:predicted nuclease of predicted toxin-antitoxin system
MKLRVDMNLSPVWVELFQAEGIEATDWSAISDPRATDQTLFDRALRHGNGVFTHDLGFGTLLALTNAASPSVVQVRIHDVTPQAVSRLAVNARRRFRITWNAARWWWWTKAAPAHGFTRSDDDEQPMAEHAAEGGATQRPAARHPRSCIQG